MLTSRAEIAIWLFAYLLSTSAEDQTSITTTADTQLPPGRTIPGCPDIDAFKSSLVQNLSTQQLERIVCLCGDENPKDQNGRGISVNCIFGSKARDLDRVLRLVKSANRTVEKIILDHIEIEENRGRELIDTLTNSEFDLTQLRHLRVRKCRGGGLLDMTGASANKDGTISNKTRGLFSGLEWLEIEYCNMEGLPTGVIANAPNLKRLMLDNNKITALKKTDLEVLTGSLEHLDLTGNLLWQQNAVESQSLAQLNALKSLSLGEHNFASETLLKEIEAMRNLEELDLTRIDGIEETTKLRFSGGNKLKKLMLTGCNLRFLNRSSFTNLTSLESLDLRVNLIEGLDDGCFKGLRNLRLLSLAGNFIREFPTEGRVWADLPNLTHLDLGWNELRVLNKTTFAEMGDRLEQLNLRNNEELKEINDDTFNGMTGLKQLNLSGISLDEFRVGMFNLPNLKSLDLSFCNISTVGAMAFDQMKGTLEWLNLAGNQLKSLDERTLNEMTELKKLDLSQNKWLCDEKMVKTVRLIDGIYKNAAKNSKEFELHQSEKTLCDRPYSLRGQSIFELLNVDNGTNLTYIERLDTTTEATTIQFGFGNNISNDMANTTAINWKLVTFLIGGNENDDFNATENGSGAAGTGLFDPRGGDAEKPKYDINQIKFGQKTANKNGSNTWISGIIVTLLIIVTAICIILVVRRKKNDSGEKEKPKENSETTEL